MRRHQLEIIADILQAAKRGTNKTRIMYRADVNFKQTQKYLGKLMEKGLLTETKHERKKLFQISDKGLEYLHKYNELKELLTIGDQ